MLELIALAVMAAIVLGPMGVDLVVTASQVVKSEGALVDRGTAGATITAGQSLYRDASDLNRMKLADSNTQAQAECRGVALHAALANQPVEYQRGGDLKIGAGAAPGVGVVFVVSATAGGIAPAADLGAGQYTTVIGVGDGVDTIVMPEAGPFASGKTA
jgi:hypothetical protein